MRRRKEVVKYWQDHYNFLYSVFCSSPQTSKKGARIRARVQRVVNKWVLVLVLNDADLSILKKKPTLLLPSNKRKNVGGMHILCSSSAN